MTSDSAPPRLERSDAGGLTLFSDPGLDRRTGILVAFTTRNGGVSEPPYETLDLAGHTGDEPARVDENRRRLLETVRLDPGRLVSADQVHGETLAVVEEGDAGRGAEVASGRAPVPETDALLTTATDLPLLLLYADCVPVVIVAEAPVRAVAVVHAGWRGAFARLPGIAARALADLSGGAPCDLAAYVGPHIGPCHYEVSPVLASSFHERFAYSKHPVDIHSVSRPRVDLGAAVRASLEDAGMLPERIAELDMCTFEHTGLFYSYRAEGVTGRHGALAAVRA